MTDALARLTWHYEHPRAAALAQHRQGRPVVGVTSNTVPWEIVRAAGAFPVLVTAAHEATPLADPFMEPVFDRRIRSVFEDVLAGRWSFLRLMVMPRTSEWEHKLYLYLLEVRRQAPRRKALPPPYLYDLLHARSTAASRHGLARTQALKDDLQAAVGRTFGVRQLAAAVAESNRARRAQRALLRLRRGRAPRLNGSEAMALLGAWFFMDRREYAALATRAAGEIARRPPLPGPRVMIKGSPLDHPALHRAIERHGAVVVAEDDWWGSRSAGRDVAGGGSIVSLFRKYYLDAPGPRVFPPDVADAWFMRESLRDIDGVVYYLPPDDDVLGWDYPRHRRFLEGQGVPVTLVRADARHLSAAEHDRLAEFVAGLAPRRLQRKARS